jgi:hypothetical protein
MREKEMRKALGTLRKQFDEIEDEDVDGGWRWRRGPRSGTNFFGKKWVLADLVLPPGQSHHRALRVLS